MRYSYEFKYIRRYIEDNEKREVFQSTYLMSPNDVLTAIEFGSLQYLDVEMFPTVTLYGDIFLYYLYKYPDRYKEYNLKTYSVKDFPIRKRKIFETPFIQLQVLRGIKASEEEKKLRGKLKVIIYRTAIKDEDE